MSHPRTVFDTITDFFHIPLHIAESPITKKTDRKRIKYRIVGSLSPSSQHIKTDNGPQYKVRQSDNLIELVAVTVGVDQNTLNTRVRKVSSLPYTHALHLIFFHHVVPTHTTTTGRTIAGYTRAYSVESVKQTVQHVLKELRTESQRQLRLEKTPTKKELGRYAPVYGVIEFGPTNGGIHCHLLITCHSNISESWIQDVFAKDGTVRLHSIGIPVPATSIRVPAMVERDKAITYVVSRILQYEMIPQMNWASTYGDISMSDCDRQLVIDTIDSHQTPTRFDGRKKGLPRFRPQPQRRK